MDETTIRATRLQLRRRSIEHQDEAVASPGTPSKKRGGKLAVKPQLDNISENAVIDSPKRTTRRSNVAQEDDKPLTPLRRSSRLKSNTSLNDVSLTESPKAKRITRRLSLATSDYEASNPNTPVKTTRRTGRLSLDSSHTKVQKKMNKSVMGIETVNEIAETVEEQISDSQNKSPPKQSSNVLSQVESPAISPKKNVRMISPTLPEETKTLEINSPQNTIKQQLNNEVNESHRKLILDISDSANPKLITFNKSAPNIQKDKCMKKKRTKSTSSMDKNTEVSKSLLSDTEIIKNKKTSLKREGNSPKEVGNKENIFTALDSSKNTSKDIGDDHGCEKNSSVEPMEVDETLQEFLELPYENKTPKVDDSSHERDGVVNESLRVKRRSVSGSFSNADVNKSKEKYSDSELKIKNIDTSEQNDQETSIDKSTMQITSPKQIHNSISEKSENELEADIVRNHMSLSKLRKIKGVPNSIIILKDKEHSKLNVATSTPNRAQFQAETIEEQDKSNSSSVSRASNLIESEAEDAGDDYESGDSQDDEEWKENLLNEIPVRGESLESTSEEDIDSNSDYEKDSFVVSSDEEDYQMLSGSGDDLDLSDNELTQSAKSKKKFNDKKCKEQKSASREMFDARHDIVSKKTSGFAEHLDESVGKRKKSNVPQLVSSSSSEDSDTGENEISIENNITSSKDPLSASYVKSEPSSKNASAIAAIEHFEVDRNATALVEGDQTKDPLAQTMNQSEEDNDTDSLTSENEEIRDNYENILGELNSSNNINKQRKSKSLDYKETKKQCMDDSIISKLNVSITKKKQRKNEQNTSSGDDLVTSKHKMLFNSDNSHEKKSSEHSGTKDLIEWSKTSIDINADLVDLSLNESSVTKKKKNKTMNESSVPSNHSSQDALSINCFDDSKTNKKLRKSACEFETQTEINKSTTSISSKKNKSMSKQSETETESSEHNVELHNKSDQSMPKEENKEKSLLNNSGIYAEFNVSNSNKSHDKSNPSSSKKNKNKSLNKEIENRKSSNKISKNTKTKSNTLPETEPVINYEKDSSFKKKNKKINIQYSDEATVAEEKNYSSSEDLDLRLLYSENEDTNEGKKSVQGIGMLRESITSFSEASDKKKKRRHRKRKRTSGSKTGSLDSSSEKENKKTHSDKTTCRKNKTVKTVQFKKTKPSQKNEIASKVRKLPQDFLDSLTARPVKHKVISTLDFQVEVVPKKKRPTQTLDESVFLPEVPSTTKTAGPFKVTKKAKVYPSIAGSASHFGCTTQFEVCPLPTATTRTQKNAIVAESVVDNFKQKYLYSDRIKRMATEELTTKYKKVKLTKF